MAALQPGQELQLIFFYTKCEAQHSPASSSPGFIDFN